MADKRQAGRASVEDSIQRLDKKTKTNATKSLKDPDVLNPQQELFCQFIASGTLKKEAAKKAGYQGSDSVLSVQASRLLGSAKVKKRIAELQAQVAVEAKFTRETHLAKLAEIRDYALRWGQGSAAVSAEALRGKICGFHDPEIEGRQAVGERLSKLTVADQFKLLQEAVRKIEATTGLKMGVTVIDGRVSGSGVGDGETVPGGAEEPAGRDAGPAIGLAASPVD